MLLARAPRWLSVGIAALFTLALAVTAALIVVSTWGGGTLVRMGLSAKLHRAVSFRRATLRLFSGDPTIVITDLKVPSPPAISRDDLLQAATVVLHLRAAPLLLGRIELRSVSIQGAQLTLVRLGHARNNYTFGGGGSGKLLGGVTNFSVLHSRWSMRDPDRHIVMSGPLEHETGSALPLLMQGEGTVSEEPVSVVLRGDALNGRDPKKPWPVAIHVIDGAATMNLEGSVQAPFDFRGFDLKVAASGPNLAALGALLRIAAPNSRQFVLTTRAQRSGHVVRLSALKARLGSSDLAGEITSDHSRPKRKIVAKLQSETLQATDLAILISPPVPHASSRITPGAKPHADARGARRPLPIDALRKLDAQLNVSAVHVEGYALPLRDVRLQVALAEGKLTADPIHFQLPAGTVDAKVTANAGQPTPSGALRATLRGARIAALRPKLRLVLDGDLDATADLRGVISSLEAILSSASGRVTFRVSHGRMQRAPSAVLSGDPLAAVALAFSGKGMQPLNCAAGVFVGRDGVFRADQLIVSTSTGTASGGGNVDLGGGQIHLKLQGHPSRRFATAAPPVLIAGPIAHPRVTVDKGAVVASGLTGAVAAIVTAPLVLLTPKSQPNMKANCVGGSS